MTLVPMDWSDSSKTFIDQETLDRLQEIYGGSDGLANDKGVAQTESISVRETTLLTCGM